MRHTFRHLQAQTYPWWHLQVFVQAESIQQLQAVLQEADDLDSRVSILPPGEDSRGGDQEKPGDHVDILLTLEPGDCLAASALWDVASYLEAYPTVDMVYVDEDQLDSRGHRHSPWFKPDWSPELLYSVDYLRPHFIRRRTLMQDPGLTICRDRKIDLSILREAAISGRIQVGHLPKVLLHRISHEHGRSQYPSAGQERQAGWVERWFRDRGKESVEVTFPASNELRISWATEHPLVSIIIPTQNRNVLERCLRSLTKKTAYPRYEILILDSGKTGTTEGLIAQYPTVGIPIRIIPTESPFNYSRTNNEGAYAAVGEFFLFLNDDTEIIAGDWLEEMVRWAEIPDIGAVGAKLFYPDKTIQHAGVIVGLGGHANHVFLGAQEEDDGPFGPTNWYRNFLAVTGACMMVRREVFAQVGGFNEDYQLAFGDIELCLRIIESGMRVMVTPFARLIHREGASRGRYMPYADMKRAAEVLMPLIREGDPYFNPNLSYSSTYPRLAVDTEDRAARLQMILEKVAPGGRDG
jgi:GT2 family glycosyltransferase